jgi:hypothetical protein
MGSGLAVAAWAFSLGLQWPVLQVAAWLNMAVEYREQMSWTAAVEEAVTGPKCAMCLAIEDARAGAGETDAPAPAVVQDISFVIGLPPAGDDRMKPGVARWAWPVDASRMASRRDEPPAPPPRGVA